MAKGIRLLNKKPFSFIQENIHTSKGFRKQYYETNLTKATGNWRKIPHSANGRYLRNDPSEPLFMTF